jgi:hypothetical protein
LWIYLEARVGAGADGIIDIRPVPVLDHARSSGGYVDPEGVAWPARDIEALFRPPITVRCHGSSRTLPRDQRGLERCGAVLRIDEDGQPAVVSLE